MKLVECVPNISEGRDKKIIEKVTAEVESVEGVRLFDVDPGAATNRTVITFVADPEAAKEAAFRLIRKAAELIDMRQHRGEHPRNGATDVCPFVPLLGTDMDDCVELARQLGERVGAELKIPIYLYEHAAKRPERKNLAYLRQGEYEALESKLGQEEWKPDFGPDLFCEQVARSGATQIGAREFLIAYNINLNTQDVKFARRIGLAIREQGGAVVRDENKQKVRGSDGKFLKHEKGLFEHCKATGWFIEEYNLAQVTMNLTNYKVTPFHKVFDKVCELAEEMGVRVIGSEIVGLIPLEAMLEAGRHYLAKQGASTGVPEKDLIDMAVQSTGLSQISKFDPKERIIEYRVGGSRPLVQATVSDFADELSRSSPAPGGGSVAALCGALSAGLTCMVANLTVGKDGYEEVQKEMKTAAAAAQYLKNRLVHAVDDDTFAFNKVMDCFRLPKGSEEQKNARKTAVTAANKNATLVPLSVLETVPEILKIADVVVSKGNQSSLSDAGVSVLTARTAAMGAYYNVLTNLAGIDDSAFKNEMRSRADLKIAEVVERCNEMDSKILARLKEPLG